MYLTPGSAAAVLMALMASHIPMALILPPLRDDTGSDFLVCSDSTILLMSTTRTPDLGSTGVDSLKASNEPKKPATTKKNNAEVNRVPQMTARVVLRKSFILIYNYNLDKCSNFVT